MSKGATLGLEAFSQGTKFLTPAVCAALAEAAAVRLEQEGHRSGVALADDGAGATVTWAPVAAAAGNSHADGQRATEDGAVALAILLVRACFGYEPIRQSRKGTGFDRHLGSGTPSDPFDGTRCLEVSGIGEDTRQRLDDRLNQKRAQVAKGGQGLPGYAVIIGFRTPAARVGGIA